MPAAPITDQPVRSSVIQFAPRIDHQCDIQIAPQIFVPDIAAGGSNMVLLFKDYITIDNGKRVSIANTVSAARAKKARIEMVRSRGLREISTSANQLFNTIYDTDHIPNNWLQSTFVAIPKKPNAKKCSEYRTISLMSHTLRIFLKVIHARIYKKAEKHKSQEQFGFRNGLGTRVALFSKQILVQRCCDINQKVYLYFIDFEKAFDKVRHEKLIEVLRKIGIDGKYLQFMTNLYWHQQAKIRINNTLSNDFRIRRGVRQGCILSPIFFNLYSE
ncbi:hypothetical protein QTP88_021544 [Uroleucon formosanum]